MRPSALHVPLLALHVPPCALLALCTVLPKGRLHSQDPLLALSPFGVVPWVMFYTWPFLSRIFVSTNGFIISSMSLCVALLFCDLTVTSCLCLSYDFHIFIRFYMFAYALLMVHGDVLVFSCSDMCMCSFYFSKAFLYFLCFLPVTRLWYDWM